VDDVMGLSIQEIAVLCVLMLRGPQTPGELRTRTGRIETFEDLAKVEAVLDGLIVRELVVRLPRHPGQKEVRYAHFLAGDGQAVVEAPVKPGVSTPADADRLAVLEEAVEELKKELADLRAQVVAFRAQFE
jgi:hypothetical protein